MTSTISQIAVPVFVKPSIFKNVLVGFVCLSHWLHRNSFYIGILFSFVIIGAVIYYRRKEKEKNAKWNNR